MNTFKSIAICSFVWIAHGIRCLLMRSERAHGMLFIPGFESLRWQIGKWKAFVVFQQAKHGTPAYKEFLKEHHCTHLPLLGWDPVFSALSVTDKESYVKKYSIESRCKKGVLPSMGVVIDESSGTSGTPNNWVRGPEERAAIQRTMQISMHALIGHEPLFLINAFALGPWATGMNVSMSLVDVAILKSTGPDIVKIENTLLQFGPKYRYLITGYPPFLKLLADSTRVNWSEYNVTVIFGGEGMSEDMRSYLSGTFKKIYGSYGASDLEINMAAENDFTIGLRQFIRTNEDLRKALTHTEYGTLPMIFQYNPLDYFIETNAEGELLITLCRTSNIAPKIRYNIHDLGHVIRMPDLIRKLHDLHIDPKSIEGLQIDLPVLFHYGRSDMSVAYYGCKVTPGNIEELIFSMPALTAVVSTFALLVSEDEKSNKRLTIALEMKKDTECPLPHDQLRTELLDQLKKLNQDYRESSTMIPKGMEPEVAVFAFGEGPFAKNDIRLKKQYIQQAS